MNIQTLRSELASSHKAEIFNPISYKMRKSFHRELEIFLKPFFFNDLHTIYTFPSQRLKKKNSCKWDGNEKFQVLSRKRLGLIWSRVRHLHTTVHFCSDFLKGCIIRTIILEQFMVPSFSLCVTLSSHAEKIFLLRNPPPLSHLVIKNLLKWQ